MDKKIIKKIDRENMFEVLKNFPAQVKEALRIAGKFNLKNFKTKGIENVIISGLGGSAIGGDLIRSFTQYEMQVPVVVNRNYILPGYAGKNTLVIISSYSGNTEETISAYQQAIKAKCRIICVTSGGEVKKLAKQNGHNCLIIPGGLQPRCALGYSFFSLLTIFIKLGLIEDRKKEIKETVNILEEGKEEFTNLNPEKNVALKVAIDIKDKLPVIYSSADVMDVVNLRWRGQISENAKILAYGNVYPEMNHNELVGWKLNENILEKVLVVFLKDEADHDRIKMRMNITTDIIRKYADNIMTLESNAKEKLARIFDLIYLGDWVSFYLAILNEVNPTPVEAISYLKTELEKL